WVFFPYTAAERTTQWERGSEPLTQATFTFDHDEHGQPRGRLSVAVPRGHDPRQARQAGAYLATLARTVYAKASRTPIHDRIASATTLELKNDGSATLVDFAAAVMAGSVSGA